MGVRFLITALHGREARIVLNVLQFHGLEQQRRPFENEEHKHHRADEQDEELHRDLGHRVEQQAEPALRHRFSGEIALHLRLIAAEVSQRQKHPANYAAPDVIAVVPIEVESDGIQPSCSACQ